MGPLIFSCFLFPKTHTPPQISQKQPLAFLRLRRIFRLLFCSSLCGLWLRVPRGRVQAFTMSVSYSYMKGMCRCRVLVFVANYFHMILIIVKDSFVVSVNQLDFYANIRIYHCIITINYVIIFLTRKYSLRIF